MRTPTHPRLPGVAIAALAASLLLATSLLPAGAQGAISYTKEPYKSYEEQLAAGQIQEVTINKRLRSLRVTLTDGRHVLAKYAAHEEPKVRRNLAAKAVTVHVLSTTAATSVAAHGKTKVHHKIRYIVGGVVIALVVIVGGVVFYNRRKRAQAGI
jgi:hypothetical protein